MMLVDLAVSRLGFIHGRAQDLADNFLPLVAEQRSQAVGRPLEMFIEQAQNRGQIGRLEAVTQLLLRTLEFLLASKPAHSRNDVVIAEVQHPEADLLLLVRNARADLRGAYLSLIHI